MFNRLKLRIVVVPVSLIQTRNILSYDIKNRLSSSSNRLRILLSVSRARLRNVKTLSKYFLLTNVLFAGAIDYCGDTITQKAIEKSQSNDWSRTGRMGVMGMVTAVPFHYWYILLDKLFPKTTSSHVLAKVVIDAAISGPLYVAGFYLGIGKLEGKTWKESYAEMKQKFLVTLLFDVSFFCVVQFVNFAYMPLTLRLVFLNSTSMAWSVLISSLKHNEAIVDFSKE